MLVFRIPSLVLSEQFSKKWLSSDSKVIQSTSAFNQSLYIIFIKYIINSVSPKPKFDSFDSALYEFDMEAWWWWSKFLFFSVATITVSEKTALYRQSYFCLSRHNFTHYIYSHINRTLNLFKYLIINSIHFGLSIEVTVLDWFYLFQIELILILPFVH